MTRLRLRHVLRRPRTTAERRATAAARVPRLTTRDDKGRPHILLAERDLFCAAIHAAIERDESAQWDIEQAAKHLAATDGPRSVRTRARRLGRRLARVLTKVCD